MNNTMTAHAHEPINYLDSIINEEEKRCEYSHQWRNFTISRSGRFKSKNKKRDIVDGKLFDTNAASSSSSSSSSAAASSASTMSRDDGGRSTGGHGSHMDYDKTAARQQPAKPYQQQQQQSFQQQAPSTRGVRGKAAPTYKSFYETNL